MNWLGVRGRMKRRFFVQRRGGDYVAGPFKTPEQARRAEDLVVRRGGEYGIIEFDETSRVAQVGGWIG